MWEVQHCPEHLDSGQKKTTGVRSHRCCVKSHRAPKVKNINICSESHVNDCVCGSLSLSVLRLGTPFIPPDSMKSTQLHLCCHSGHVALDLICSSFYLVTETRLFPLNHTAWLWVGAANAVTMVHGPKRDSYCPVLSSALSGDG